MSQMKKNLILHAVWLCDSFLRLPPPPPQPDQSKESTVTTTTSVEVAATVESEQNQQENDTIAALQEEVTRLQANVDKKDSMLTMLTDGLKEVHQCLIHSTHQPPLSSVLSLISVISGHTVRAPSRWKSIKPLGT